MDLTKIGQALAALNAANFDLAQSAPAIQSIAEEGKTAKFDGDTWQWYAADATEEERQSDLNLDWIDHSLLG